MWTDGPWGALPHAAAGLQARGHSARPPIACLACPERAPARWPSQRAQHALRPSARPAMASPKAQRTGIVLPKLYWLDFVVVGGMVLLTLILLRYL